MSHYTEPKPTRDQIREKAIRDKFVLEVRLDSVQRILQCPHESMEDVTEEDYDGHRTDYYTYWRCPSCGWSQKRS